VDTPHDRQGLSTIIRRRVPDLRREVSEILPECNEGVVAFDLSERFRAMLRYTLGRPGPRHDLIMKDLKTLGAHAAPHWSPNWTIEPTTLGVSQDELVRRVGLDPTTCGLKVVCRLTV
jgi:hypothetical protein